MTIRVNRSVCPLASVVHCADMLLLLKAVRKRRKLNTVEIDSKEASPKAPVFLAMIGSPQSPSLLNSIRSFTLSEEFEDNAEKSYYPTWRHNDFEAINENLNKQDGVTCGSELNLWDRSQMSHTVCMLLRTQSHGCHFPHPSLYV